ncbi:hypothetical protein Q73_16550 [Bacillus coahuilensis m2-6]|uniref:hypothetical protein n=1 Tax=Bacillus coahuilensis TaxID=408580 RepID=UPI0007504744|nr:hypothetical protein [Bacillus coahuilensis]KUP03942.1 hypothetical protein Q73_16550 [Bacillus coahuilensis m2-6]
MMLRTENYRQSLITRVRFLSLLLLLGIILVITSPVIFTPGYIVFSDLDYGLQDESYFSRIVGLYNEQFSTMNFFNLSRFAFILPFSFIVEAFQHLEIPHLLLRCILLAIFLLAGFGIFYLLEFLLTIHFKQFHSWTHYIGITLPAVFYTINPWVVLRIQHVFLLVGYAVFPWILLYFLRLFPLNESGSTIERKLSWEHYSLSLKIGFLIAIGSAAIHYFFYIAVVLAFMWLMIVIKEVKWSTDKKNYIQFVTKKTMILSITVLLFNGYWFVTYILSLFVTSIEPQNVNVVDTLSMFSRFSSIPNVLLMVSYWWPMFELTDYLDWMFWICGSIFILLILYIIFFRFGWHFYIRLFTILLGLTLTTALGVNTSIISEFNIFLVTKVPVIGHIFRDPNKLIGPMALFYSILLGFSIDRIIYSLKSNGFSKFITVSFLLLLTISYYFYIRPFSYIFLDHYYKAVAVPEEYTTVQSNTSDKGKILWIPTMDNMTLSSGISSYSWNVPESELNLTKANGDFHVYSSEKKTVFQHENNNYMVSYMYAFMQNMLDTGHAQHIGKMAAWMGFNEIGFHEDVYYQDKRQRFNLETLHQQEDLNVTYENDIFHLFEVKAKSPDEFVSKSVVLTKPMNRLTSLLDFSEELHVSSEDTALLWLQTSLNPIPLPKQTYLVGDNKLDFLLPYVDSSYYHFPFDDIDTGNPYLGWAKTRSGDASWFWALRANNLENEWDLDLGKGIVYTYVPYKLDVPPHRLGDIQGPPLITMEDVLDNFFIPDNPELFQMTVYPNRNHRKSLEATVTPKKNNPLWQVAKSKEMVFDGNKPRFLRIKATMSGVNAGSVHFKVRFYDQEKTSYKLATSLQVSR